MAAEPTASVRSDDEEIDLHTVVALIWRGRLWVLSIALVLGGLAAAHAFLSQPVYRSEALLSVRSTELGGAGRLIQDQLGGLTSLVGAGLGGSGNNRQEFLAYLKSRALAKEFVERYGLMQLFYASQWDAATKTFRPARGRSPTVLDAADVVLSLRDIEEDARTGLLTVSFYWSDPQVTARWVNDYVALANERLREEAISDSRKSVEYLNEELSRTVLEPVRQSLFRIMEGRLNQVMLASVEPEYGFRVIDRAEPSPPDNFVRPNRAMEIVLGTLFGLLLGMVWVLWRSTGAGAAER